MTEEDIIPNSDYKEILERIERKDSHVEYRRIFNTHYTPLTSEEVQDKYDLYKGRMQLKELLNDLIMFVFYMIILYPVVLSSLDDMAYTNRVNIEEILVKAAYTDSFQFSEISTDSSFRKYLNETFIPAIYGHIWYGNYSMASHKGLIVDFNTKMLGVPRLRQLRILNETCKVPRKLDFIAKDCNLEFSNDIQETKHFGESWISNVKKLGNKRNDKIWQYQNKEQSQTVIMFGTIANYPAGGYIAELGRTEINTKLTLDYIKQTGWIDELTRVIFIEIVFYNANSNLFTIVTLIIEKSATGKYLTGYRIRTAKLLFLHYELENGTCIIFILFMLMILIFTCRRGRTLYKSKIRAFFSYTWNIVDLIIIIMAIILIVFFFIRSQVAGHLLKELDKAKHNVFVSFILLAHWDDVVTILACILVAISTVRLWRLLEFSRMFRICELTLLNSLKDIFSMTIIGAMVLLSFSISGYIIFGSYGLEFCTIVSTSITLLSLSLGFRPEFQYELFNSVSNYLGYIFYVFFMVLMLIVITIFIIVLLESYEKSRIYFDGSEEEKLISYNLLKYISEEIKYFRNKKGYRKQFEHLAGGQDKKETKIRNEKILNSLIIEIIQNYLDCYEKNDIPSIENTKFLVTILELLIKLSNFQNIDNSHQNQPKSNVSIILNYFKSNKNVCNCPPKYTDLEKNLTNIMHDINNKMNKLLMKNIENKKE